MKLTYDEISPITGNKCVLVEYDDLHGETRLCMESGYQHLERYIDGNEVCERFEQTCPQIIKDSRFVDDNQRVWYKLIIVTPTTVLLPNWRIIPIRLMQANEDISTSELTLIKDDEIYVIDTPSTVEFDNFADALDNFYKIISL